MEKKYKSIMKIFAALFLSCFSFLNLAYAFGLPEYSMKLPTGSKAIIPLSKQESEYIYNIIIKNCQNCSIDDIDDLDGYVPSIYKGNFSNESSEEYMTLGLSGSGTEPDIYFFKISNNKATEIQNETVTNISVWASNTGSVPEDSPAFILNGKTYLRAVPSCDLGAPSCNEMNKSDYGGYCTLIWDGKKNIYNIVSEYSSRSMDDCSGAA